MRQILVLHTEREVIKKTEVKQDLLWYDHKKKVMNKFSGGKLVFEYGYDKDLDEFRLLPKVESLLSTTKTKVADKKGIIDWFDIYSNYNNTQTTIAGNADEGVIFDVQENELDDFMYSLERENIGYKKL